MSSPAECQECQSVQQALRLSERPVLVSDSPAVRAIDLFCGCGGLTLGLQAAAQERGRGLDVVLAVDVDPAIARVYQANFPEANVVVGDVDYILPGDPGTGLGLGPIGRPDYPVDFLLAGPPCQGHSDLNNHTRRSDDRNQLYLKTARAAEVFEPTFAIVENVPAVLHDRSAVVARTRAAFEALGYAVGESIVDLSWVGVAQRRRRHVFLASRDTRVSPEHLLDSLRRHGEMHTPASVRTAIGDLEHSLNGSVFDSPSSPSPRNRERMEYLLEHGLFELPDSERPACHRNGGHSYRSVYGRLSWDKPAPTITTGFGSMGQGRFVHPSQARTLTPHEAARLQGFPDWFRWGDSRRSTLATSIGNAVPPALTHLVGRMMLNLAGLIEASP